MLTAVFRSLLKVTFSQFCLDQQISQAHVDFGAIESSICHRDACPESEMWICSWLYIKYRIDSPVPEYAGIAEHVHQQGVGTGAGIKFSPLAAFTPGKRLTLSVHFFPDGVASWSLFRIALYVEGRKFPWRESSS